MTPLSTNEWLNLIQLIGGGLLGSKLLHVVLQMRDSLRDLGSREPPTGLFAEVDRLEIKVEKHDGWLIQIRTRLGISN